MKPYTNITGRYFNIIPKIGFWAICQYFRLSKVFSQMSTAGPLSGPPEDIGHELFPTLENDNGKAQSKCTLCIHYFLHAQPSSWTTTKQTRNNERCVVLPEFSLCTARSERPGCSQPVNNVGNPPLDDIFRKLSVAKGMLFTSRYNTTRRRRRRHCHLHRQYCWPSFFFPFYPDPTPAWHGNKCSMYPRELGESARSKLNW